MPTRAIAVMISLISAHIAWGENSYENFASSILRGELRLSDVWLDSDEQARCNIAVRCLYDQALLNKWKTDNQDSYDALIAELVGNRFTVDTLRNLMESHPDYGHRMERLFGIAALIPSNEVVRLVAEFLFKNPGLDTTQDPFKFSPDQSILAARALRSLGVRGASIEKDPLMYDLNDVVEWRDWWANLGRYQSEFFRPERIPADQDALRGEGVGIPKIFDGEFDQSSGQQRKKWLKDWPLFFLLAILAAASIGMALLFRK